MSEEYYRKLARHLDNLPGGFPATESGVEQRILRRLFTPEEAELATHLTLIPEKARVIAHRAKITEQEAAERLEEMARKGLIYNIQPRRGEPVYMASQFVVGIWEYQLNRLDPEFIQDMDEYFETLVDFDTWREAPQLRTIPVGESIDPQMEVMSYETAQDLVNAQKRISVAPCICRRERNMIGEGCDKPLETCLSFGSGADFYQRNGLGRSIDRQEALEILDLANDAGLVLQPGNSQKPVFICCCCGDCCGVLRNIKRHPKPASVLSSPFRASIDIDSCTNCGVCETRCQMEAITLEDGIPILDLDRCIGCGLCATTCPTGSIILLRKPEDEQPFVPKNTVGAYLHLAQTRGKINNTNLVMMQLKSKVDRLLSSM